MEGIFNTILQQYQILLLVLVRISGIFVFSPIFSRHNIPNIMKIGFSFFLSILVFNVVKFSGIDYNGYQLILIMIEELIIGLIIGFIAYLFFSSLYIAGQIVDMQIGFGMVNVLDPQQRVQIPIMGNFFYIIAILVLLVINGHHSLIKAVVTSYSYIPIGEFVFKDSLLVQFVEIFTEVFVIGVKISSPILATIFLTNVLLGILARTMPQMNVFMVGMPLKIIVGIATLAIFMSLYVLALQHIFENMYEEIFKFLKVINNG